MNQNIFFLFLLLLCSTAAGMEESGLLLLHLVKFTCCKSMTEYIASKKNTQTIIDTFAVDKTEILSPEEILFYENMCAIRTLLQVNRKCFKEINSFYKDSILQYNCHINCSFFAVNFASYFGSIYKKAHVDSSIDNFYIEIIAKDIATINSNILALIFSDYAASDHIARLYGPSSFNMRKKRSLEKKIKKDTFPLVYLLNRILYFKNSKQIVLQSANQIKVPSYLQTLSLKYDIHITKRISSVSQTKTFYTIFIQKITDDTDDFGMNPTICTIL